LMVKSVLPTRISLIMSLLKHLIYEKTQLISVE
jgi:hypothetical protein